MVKAGENIPMDGVITQGNGMVDESAIIGESMPQTRQVGDMVTSATINTDGYFSCGPSALGTTQSWPELSS